MPATEAERLHITECPRDAMQGIKEFIPTEKKIEYISALLECGFDFLDAGSFVSPKAIPQMADTQQVFDAILDKKGSTEIIAIVANERGALQAAAHPATDWLGFPLSVSETFQQRNTNKSVTQAYDEVMMIRDIAKKEGRGLTVYLSMAFGNPYGDDYSVQSLLDMAKRLEHDGIGWISVADTIGAAGTEDVSQVIGYLTKHLSPKTRLSAHIHCTPYTAPALAVAVYEAGCRYIDSAMGGFGGCPMAKDDLTGNMPTEAVLGLVRGKNLANSLNFEKIGQAQMLVHDVFRVLA